MMFFHQTQIHTHAHTHKHTLIFICYGTGLCLFRPPANICCFSSHIHKAHAVRKEVAHW